MRRIGRRSASLFCALIVALTSVLPGGLLTASAAEGGLENLHGANVTTAVTGYEVKDNNGNNFAMSDVHVDGAFTFKANIKFQTGERKATLVFGAGSNNTAELGGPSAAKKNFGLEFTGDTENSRITLKMFQDGQGCIGDNIIAGGTVGATDVDFSKNIPVEVSVDDGKNLAIKIDGKDATFTLNKGNEGKTFADAYEGGYLGLLTYRTQATFYNTRVTTPDGSLDTPLTNVQGPSVVPLTTSRMTRIVNGNNIAVSDTKTAFFEYSADLTYIEGNKISIMFGAETNSDPNKFFAVEIERSGDADNATLKSKAFQDGPNSIGEFMAPTVVATGVDTTQPINVKLVVTTDKTIELYINGQPAGDPDNPDNKFEPDLTKFKSAYAGGYLGMVTFDTTASFADFRVVNNGTEVTDGFRTNLTNLSFLNGTWNRNDNGLYSNGNDIFAMSDVSVKNFIFEADVTIEGNAAAGLVFRAKSNTDPKGVGTYIANLHIERGTARIFTFGMGAGDVGTSYTVPDAEKGTYHLKIVAANNKINYYVDDVLASAINNAQFSDAGYLGLMTFGGAVTYQDVTFEEIQDGGVPALTGLEVTGGSLGLSPEFDPEGINYTVFAGNAEKVTVKPTAAAGTDLTIAATGPDGMIFDATPVESGIGKEITLPVGVTTVTVMATKGDLSIGTTIKITKKASATYMAAEPYRPQFHFSPEINFMNDPNGLCYDPSNNTWHMFFQYSPQVGHMGSQTWGHAQSTDLVTWKEMPVAIPMDHLGAIFSGSCVIDENNTSGFFDDNKPGESKMVAIFTHAGGRGQVQSIAYSKDHGVTFTTYENNPVLDEDDRIYGHDFRDPKVWWQEDPDEPAQGIWLMAVAGGRGRLFSSHDLKEWKDEQAFLHDNGSGNELHSECPALFPVTMEDGTEKWLYVASSDWYAVGDLVKEAGGWRFKNVTDPISCANGGASKMYAGQHFYNDGTGQDRKMMVHWLQDYSAPGTFPDKRWNGVQSIPTVMGLKMIDGKYHMTAYPVEEIDDYRDQDIFSTQNKVVNETTPNILAGAVGQYYDLEGIFTPGTAKAFGFKLRTGNGQETVVKYDVENEKLIFDKSKSGPIYTERFEWVLHPMEDGKVQIRVLVDNSVIEVFGNYGDADMGDLCFPDPDSIGMEFFVEGGDVTIDKLNIWQMKSMFTGSSVGADPVDPMFFSLSAPDIVDPGEEFTVRASVLPINASDKTVTWGEIPADLEVIEKTDTYLVLKTNKEGTYKITATTKVGDLEAEVDIQVMKRVFNTNLADWIAKGGNWVKTGEGMRGNNANSGDSFYLSQNKLPDTPFTLTADVKTYSGNAATLVFGVQDLNNPNNTWFFMNADQNISKFVKNVNGQEKIREEIPLTAEEKLNRTHKFKIVYDGTDMIAYINDREVGRANAATAAYQGGYVGILTYYSDSVFNNVVMELEGEIESVDPIEDIDVELGSGATLESLKASLPQEVTVVMDSGMKITAKVLNWDVSGVDLTKEGTYDIIGTLEGTELKATIQVVVKLPATIVSIEPDEIDIAATTDQTPAEVLAEIKAQHTFKAIMSDDTEKPLVLTGWKLKDGGEPDFTTAGIYIFDAIFTMDGEEIEETITINVGVRSADATLKDILLNGDPFDTTDDVVTVSVDKGTTLVELLELLNDEDMMEFIAEYDDDSSVPLSVANLQGTYKPDVAGTYNLTADLMEGETVLVSGIKIQVTVRDEDEPGPGPGPGPGPDPGPGPEKPGTQRPGGSAGNSGFKWPESWVNGDKKNPSSGDASSMALAMAALAVSAGVAAVVIRKRNK